MPRLIFSILWLFIQWLAAWIIKIVLAIIAPTIAYLSIRFFFMKNETWFPGDYFNYAPLNTYFFCLGLALLVGWPVIMAEIFKKIYIKICYLEKEFYPIFKWLTINLISLGASVMGSAALLFAISEFWNIKIDLIFVKILTIISIAANLFMVSGIEKHKQKATYSGFPFVAKDKG